MLIRTVIIILFFSMTSSPLGSPEYPSIEAKRMTEFNSDSNIGQIVFTSKRDEIEKSM